MLSLLVPLCVLAGSVVRSMISSRNAFARVIIEQFALNVPSTAQKVSSMADVILLARSAAAIFNAFCCACCLVLTLPASWSGLSG